MMLDEFFDYKNELMEMLCCNSDIARLLTNGIKSGEYNPELAYTNIFPFEYIPETVDDAGSFICFDVDISDVVNKTFLLPVLYVWEFTHKSLLRIPEGGLRIDDLAVAINQKLNGSRLFGLGELELVSIRRFSPVDDYLGRVLTYSAKDFNRTYQNRQPTVSHKNRG